MKRQIEYPAVGNPSQPAIALILADNVAADIALPVSLPWCDRAGGFDSLLDRHPIS